MKIYRTIPRGNELEDGCTNTPLCPCQGNPSLCMGMFPQVNGKVFSGLHFFLRDWCCGATVHVPAPKTSVSPWDSGSGPRFSPRYSTHVAWPDKLRISHTVCGSEIPLWSPGGGRKLQLQIIGACHCPASVSLFINSFVRTEVSALVKEDKTRLLTGRNKKKTFEVLLLLLF